MCTKRALPTWMIAARDSERSKEETTNKAKTEKRTRKRCPERLMLYWMNERELMETAHDVLKKSDSKKHAACFPAAAEISVIPETDTEEEPDSDVLEKTHRSDSDVDVAEQETVPYVTCIEKKRLRRGSASASDTITTHSHASEMKPVLEENRQRTKSDAEALQLVREIFFS